MSDIYLARRAEAQVAFDGVDITEDLKPYLLSMVYQDSESDESDELQLKLQDREGIWMEQWLEPAVKGAEDSRLKITAKILCKNWKGDGCDSTLNCGTFELGAADASGPPGTVTIKAVSLPYSSGFRQTKKSDNWENCKLSVVAGDLASKAGMKLMYESKVDPSYESLEQKEESCVSFLKKLCDDAGISLKMAGDTVVLFDQASYEAKPAVLILKRGGGLYLSYRLGVKKENTQYDSCRVSYVLPSGELVEGIAKGENYEEGKGQRLEICQRVTTKAEAESIAAARLRLHNKFSKTASFTIPGNPWIAAGNTVELWGWGGWSGKYMVYKITHSVGSGGYTTKLELRRCLT